MHTPVKARTKNGSKAAARLDTASSGSKAAPESPFWSRVFPWTVTTATQASARANSEARTTPTSISCIDGSIAGIHTPAKQTHTPHTITVQLKTTNAAAASISVPDEQHSPRKPMHSHSHSHSRANSASRLPVSQSYPLDQSDNFFSVAATSNKHDAFIHSSLIPASASPASLLREQFFSPRSSPTTSMDTQSIASTINNTVEGSLGVPASIQAESPTSTFCSSRLLPDVAPSAEKHHQTSDRESFLSSPSRPTQTSATSTPLLERQSLHPSIVRNTGTPLISHEVSEAQLQTFMQMSKSPSTATLDTLAADAFVGMADVSTDLLASDISLNPHERSSVTSFVETKIELDAKKNARQEIVQETHSTVESAEKYPTAGREEKVLSPPSRPSSKIPNRSNSATLGLPNSFYLPSGRNPSSVRRASEGTVLSNEAPLLHGFSSGTASTASTLNSGRIGYSMQQQPPLQQYPAKYAPIISPHQQKERLTRFNSPVNSLHTRASTPTLATAGRYHSGRGTGSVGGTPRAVSSVFNEANSSDFGGLDETMQSQPPLLLQQQRPQNILPPPTTSMYELHSVFSTPSSQPKYSERDISAIRMEITLKFEREFEMAQLEIQDLERQRNQALEGTCKIQKTLQEWETFMKEMIAKKEADDLRSRQETAQLCFAIEKSNVERDASIKGVEDTNARMRQLRLDAEIERDISKKALLKVQQESNECVGLMEDRYQVLKAHAEEKLQEANIEIARVRAGLEKEIASLRVKISRSELHMASLEKNVESKAAENAELTKICDDLLMQIENATGN
ncbi:transforming acidic coiled-coil-containing protein-domain containing protein [Chytriomyces cf. hyalinus JEL632]|nr:transforming acidic coiled-coil-containing protein-domain containing protein [Chytriomyces cf. hyalinus JEL632]